MTHISEESLRNVRELAAELTKDTDSLTLTVLRIASLGIDNPRKQLARIHDLAGALDNHCSTKEDLASYIKHMDMAMWITVRDEFDSFVANMAIGKYIGGLFSPIVLISERFKENHFKKVAYKLRSLVAVLETTASYI